MADVLTPQFSFPMRMENGKIMEVEQDSDQDVYERALLLIHYRIGQRLTLPDFGLPDFSLRQGGVDLNILTAQIQRWVPDITLSDVEAFMNDGDQTVNIEFEDKGVQSG